MHFSHKIQFGDIVASNHDITYMQEAGYSVILGSISGGKIPLEPNSLQGDAVTPITQKWLDDGEDPPLSLRISPSN